MGVAHFAVELGLGDEGGDGVDDQDVDGAGTDQSLSDFEGLLAAFEASEKAGLGAVSYQGAMVDYAMLPLAKEVLAEAARKR